MSNVENGKGKDMTPEEFKNEHRLHVERTQGTDLDLLKPYEDFANHVASIGISPKPTENGNKDTPENEEETKT